MGAATRFRRSQLPSRWPWRDLRDRGAGRGCDHDLLGVRLRQGELASIATERSVSVSNSSRMRSISFGKKITASRPSPMRQCSTGSVAEPIRSAREKRKRRYGSARRLRLIRCPRAHCRRVGEQTVSGRTPFIFSAKPRKAQLIAQPPRPHIRRGGRHLTGEPDTPTDANESDLVFDR